MFGVISAIRAQKNLRTYRKPTQISFVENLQNFEQSRFEELFLKHKSEVPNSLIRIEGPAEVRKGEDFTVKFKISIQKLKENYYIDKLSIVVKFLFVLKNQEGERVHLLPHSFDASKQLREIVQPFLDIKTIYLIQKNLPASANYEQLFYCKYFCVAHLKMGDKHFFKSLQINVTPTADVQNYSNQLLQTNFVFTNCCCLRNFEVYVKITKEDYLLRINKAEVLECQISADIEEELLGEIRIDLRNSVTFRSGNKVIIDDVISSHVIQFESYKSQFFRIQFPDKRPLPEVNMFYRIDYFLEVSSISLRGLNWRRQEINKKTVELFFTGY